MNICKSCCCYQFNQVEKNNHALPLESFFVFFAPYDNHHPLRTKVFMVILIRSIAS